MLLSWVNQKKTDAHTYQYGKHIAFPIPTNSLEGLIDKPLSKPLSKSISRHAESSCCTVLEFPIVSPSTVKLPSLFAILHCLKKSSHYITTVRFTMLSSMINVLLSRQLLNPNVNFHLLFSTSTLFKILTHLA